MLNLLINVARRLTEVSVLIVVGMGAVYGGSITGEADREVGYVIGGIAGFCISSVVFGIAAAIFDMQKSLRFLADAARRPIPQEKASAGLLLLSPKPAPSMGV